MTCATGRVRPLAVAMLGLAVALTSCGVPRAAEPQPVPSASVPFGLLNAHTPRPSPTPNGPVGDVYFLRGGHLVAVHRRVEGIDPPAELLRSLLAGPRTKETAAGLSTAIPSQTALLSLDLVGTTATVDLNAQFGSVSGTDEVDAVAQIVYTVTASPYIQAVRFSIAGKPVDVPDASGSLSLAPRTRADYRALAG